MKRQVALILRWEALTLRQAQYEAELAKLQATGDALQAEWTALQQENQAAYEAMATDSPDAWAVAHQVWALAKHHVQQIYAKEQARSGFHTPPIPQALTTFGAPVDLDPRGAPDAGY